MTDFERLFGITDLDPTDQSVENRNRMQQSGQFHPLTCGGNRMDETHRDYQAEHGGDYGQLVAVEDGWVCPACGYRQALTRVPDVAA